MIPLTRPSSLAGLGKGSVCETTFMLLGTEFDGDKACGRRKRFWAENIFMMQACSVPSAPPPSGIKGQRHFGDVVMWLVKGRATARLASWM